MARTETLADGLLVISDLVPVDGRVSWHDPQGQGFEPHNEYLVLEDDRALLIDTGHAVHGPSLVAALEEARGARSLCVLLTRSELDCLGNLPAVVERFDDVKVVTSNALPPIGLVHLGAKQRGDVFVHHLTIGDTLAPFGFARVRSLQPVVKLLGTCWAFDEATQTLFTSDFFGAALMRTPNELIAQREASGLPSREAIRRTILAKFNWLARAEIHEVLAIWDKAFATLKPKIIAPIHGKPIVGADLVARTITDYRAAIAACRQTS